MALGPVEGLLVGFWELWGRPWSFLGRFWAHLHSKLRSEAIFFRFWTDLGWILEGFWVGFLMIFRIFGKNSDFAKTLKKHRFLQCF